MMTKKSTRSTATFANVYTMLDRDELRANGMPVKDETALIELVQAYRAGINLKRATSGERRRYYEAS